MKVHPDEPLITEEQVEAMKLFSEEEQIQLLAIFARGIAEARRRAQYETPRHDCCAEGWRLFDKGGVTYAEPCPIHKPNWVPPEKRKQTLTEEDIRAAKKREVQEWMDE